MIAPEVKAVGRTPTVQLARLAWRGDSRRVFAVASVTQPVTQGPETLLARMR
jgi:hypothetical protein